MLASSSKTIGSSAEAIFIVNSCGNINFSAPNVAVNELGEARMEARVECETWEEKKYAYC